MESEEILLIKNDSKMSPYISEVTQKHDSDCGNRFILNTGLAIVLAFAWNVKKVMKIGII